MHPHAETFGWLALLSLPFGRKILALLAARSVPGRERFLVYPIHLLPLSLSQGDSLI